MDRFDHEGLAVYGKALDFVIRVRDALSVTPPYADEHSQLARASTSIVHNIAEGAGEFSPKEKARFYRMARRSGTECASSADILLKLGHMPATDANDLRTGLLEIVRMLVKLIHSTERA